MKGSALGRGRSGLVTVTSGTTFQAATTTVLKTEEEYSNYVSFCTVKGGIEEAVYAATLTEDGGKTLLIIPDSELLSSIYAILRMALPRESWPAILQLNKKSTESQTKKVFKELKQPGKVVFVIEPRFLSQVDFKAIAFKALFVLSDQLISSWATHIKRAGAQGVKVIYFVSPHQRSSNPNLAAVAEYVLGKDALAVSSGRVAVARKIYLLQQEPSSEGDKESQERRVARERSLRERLKVLLNVPVGPVSSNMGVSFIGGKAQESGKTMRKKMIILGMIQENAGGAATSNAGRDLAQTTWLDGLSGESFDAPWQSVRYGAKCDAVSLRVREIVSDCKTFSYSTGEKELSINLRRRLQKCCRLVGFGWCPCIGSSSEDDWGGDYGKCCAHNEICMHFVRPFFPQEVLNTRLCSRKSPAPGNNGHDGCLEFFLIQCQFFKHPMTIWDNEAFHYVNSRGEYFSFKKESFLNWPENKLRLLMDNLRYLTVHCEGSESPKDIIRFIQFVLHLYNGKIKLMYSHRKTLALTGSIQAMISSFLLPKLPKASMSLPTAVKKCSSQHLSLHQELVVTKRCRF